MTRKQFFLSILGMAAAPVTIKSAGINPDMDYLYERYVKPAVEYEIGKTNRLLTNAEFDLRTAEIFKENLNRAKIGDTITLKRPARFSQSYPQA